MTKFQQARQSDGTAGPGAQEAYECHCRGADIDGTQSRHAAASIARDPDNCAQATGDFAPLHIDCVRSGKRRFGGGAAKGLSTRRGVYVGSFPRCGAPEGIGTIEMMVRQRQGRVDLGEALIGARPGVTAGPVDRGPADDDHSSSSIITRTKPKTKRPSLYRVLLLNDDYTPMEFVVLVVERFFNKSHEDAYQIMMHVHQNGVGECGIYTYEVAETKVTQVMDFARKHQHPLQCVMEKK